MDSRPRNTVDKIGAKTGCILRGAVRHNKGLRLRIFQDQTRGPGGALLGRFEILDVGDNKHSPLLKRLLGGPTDAEEVLRIIRQGSAACVNVVNANILSVETGNDDEQNC
jgi:hypothetical protein